ncbi:MAG: hypothetical protein Q8Q87_01100 [Candidatus Omnitrophota bacterium]|nr:hypothetical protein [Candidatus Omnitrophota bacterium]
MKVNSRFFFLLAAGCWLLVTATGCGPTYPEERFKESIIKVCKKEYKLDVKVETIGHTIAIYVPLENLIDFTFAITKSASEKINDVILSVSRVALSTDAKFDFYCIIAHDIRIPEIQIVIIKTVDDVKRFLLNDISRGEYSKRMLIDIRVSPQSEKERAIKEVLSRKGVDKESQEKFLGDFFRSEPAVLGDIGYWNGRFYIKDISLAEFLAEQIANRIRIEFREDKRLMNIFSLSACKGFFKGKERLFKFEISEEHKNIEGLDEEALSGRFFKAVLKVSAGVIHGYRFEAFDSLEVLNQWDGKVFRASRQELEDFRINKISLEEITKS